MGTDLLALGIVAIFVGSFLFYRMKAMAVAHRAERDADVSAARARSMALLFVGALLTAASIPANLLASSPTPPPTPPSDTTSASAAAPSATAVPSTSTSTPSPTASATATATPSASAPPSPVPRPKNTGGKPPPVRKK